MTTSLEQVTSCTICCTPYAEAGLSSAKRLPCDFIMCETCVGKIHQGREEMTCPHCKAKTRVDTIKTDHRTTTIIEALNLQAKELRERNETAVTIADDHTCDLCDRHKITGRCDTCDAWLCESCTVAHKKPLSTAQHKVREVATCAKHIKWKLIEQNNILSEMIDATKDTIADINDKEDEVESAIEHALTLTSYCEKELIGAIRNRFRHTESLIKEGYNHCWRKVSKKQYKALSVLGSMEKQRDQLAEHIQAGSIDTARFGQANVDKATRFIQSVTPPTFEEVNIPDCQITPIAPDDSYEPVKITIDGVELSEYCRQFALLID